MTRKTATAQRMRPITTEAAPSIQAIPSRWLRYTPRNATSSPASAAASSPTTMKTDGSLLPRSACQKLSPFSCSLCISRTAMVKDVPSASAATPRTM